MCLSFLATVAVVVSKTYVKSSTEVNFEFLTGVFEQLGKLMHNHDNMLDRLLFTWMSELLSSFFHSVAFTFVVWEVPFPITSLKEKPL